MARVLALSLVTVGWTSIVLALADLQNFQKHVAVLDDMKQLQAFKSMVRRQMYLSLGQLFLFWGVALACLWGVLVERWSATTIALVVVGIVLSKGFQTWRGKIREELYQLPSADKGLASLHQAVCVQWAHRTLPEF